MPGSISHVLYPFNLAQNSYQCMSDFFKDNKLRCQEYEQPFRSQMEDKGWNLEMMPVCMFAMGFALVNIVHLL